MHWRGPQVQVSAGLFHWVFGEITWPPRAWSQPSWKALRNKQDTHWTARAASDDIDEPCPPLHPHMLRDYEPRFFWGWQTFVLCTKCCVPSKREWNYTYVSFHWCCWSLTSANVVTQSTKESVGSSTSEMWTELLGTGIFCWTWVSTISLRHYPRQAALWVFTFLWHSAREEFI